MGGDSQKEGGTAFNFEGTENENSLVLGGICNSRTDHIVRKRHLCLQAFPDPGLWIPPGLTWPLALPLLEHHADFSLTRLWMMENKTGSVHLWIPSQAQLLAWSRCSINTPRINVQISNIWHLDPSLSQDLQTQTIGPQRQSPPALPDTQAPTAAGGLP